MKLFFYLSAILLTSSLLLLFSNSFTNAEIRNDATLSVVSEDNALIAVVDWEGRSFRVKNNTEEIINIISIELGRGSGVDITENLVPSIGPGGFSQITLIGDAEELSGREIQIVADWKGGSAEIISTIPEFVEEVEVVPVLENEEMDLVPQNIITNLVPGNIKTDAAPENIKTDSETEDIITDTAPEDITTSPVPEVEADPVAEETTDLETETDLESDEQ